jgi:lipopolysaccharide export system permease protein
VSADGSHVMYVEKLSRDRERAQTVFLAEEKNDATDATQHAWMLVFADQGYQTKDKHSKDQFFVTADGYRYEGSPGQNDYKIIQFKKYAVRIKQPDSHVVHQEDETLSMSQLWDDYDNPKRAAELQWRISMGIMTFLLALLAVPFSVVRPRQGRYIILLPAILVYVMYMELLFMARHWVEQEMAPTSIGLWWVHAVMLVIVGFLLLFTSKKMRHS